MYGVSKTRGNPKWMGENKGKPILELMIWGENPRFLETPMYGMVNLPAFMLDIWVN